MPTKLWQSDMMMFRRSRILVSVAALAGSLVTLSAAVAQAPARPPATAQAPAPAAAALPGGATSLQETHGDWVVGCAVQGAAKRCGVTQEQTNQQTRQRVLAVELAPAGDRIEGILLLPFGLALDQGVALQIDEHAPGPTLRFRTCLPAGCVVPVSFDARQAAALRAGTALKARVTPDGSQPTTLSISLKGLGSALDRTAVLTR